MREMDENDEITTDRGEWKKGHAAPTPNKLRQGQEEKEIPLHLHTVLTVYRVLQMYTKN
jgi:hypothetical protein